MNRKWNEKTTVEKVAEIIASIALVIWLVFEFLEMKNTVPYAELVSYIAITVVCICEAISHWNVKRSLSYVAIAGAVLLVAVGVMTAMLTM